jgi:hypothetical protein
MRKKIKDQDLILGLFYTDEDNFVIDKIRYSENQ